jgi:hypothetical protein
MQGSVRDLALLLTDDRLSWRVLPFHDHRHCPYVSFTAVLGVDVPQHCVSGPRSWVPQVFAGILDAFCVSAGETDEGRTLIVFTDAVHHS